MNMFKIGDRFKHKAKHWKGYIFGLDHYDTGVIQIRYDEVEYFDDYDCDLISVHNIEHDYNEDNLNEYI